MKQKTALWKYTMLKNLNLDEILEQLSLIEDAGDPFGYEVEFDKSGYYDDYKDLFNDLSAKAYQLNDVISESCIVREHWDDMTVTLLGDVYNMVGYDGIEMDYFDLVNGFEEGSAIEAAEKRILRLKKEEMLACFRRVLGTLLAFYDVKTAYDCLSSVVNELDEKAAMLEMKNKEINKLYSDYTEDNIDNIIAKISPNCRLWVE